MCKLGFTPLTHSQSIILISITVISTTYLSVMPVLLLQFFFINFKNNKNFGDLLVKLVREEHML